MQKGNYLFYTLMVATSLLVLPACTTVNKESNKDLHSILGRMPDNAVIRIPKSHYIVYFPIVIKDKVNLTLIWEDGSSISSTTPEMPIILIEASTNITIKNISLKYSNKESPTKCNLDGTSMIHIRNSSEVLIDNCELNGGVSVGVGAFRVDKLTINRTEIRNFTATAFRMELCGAVYILQSLIEKNGSVIKAGTIASLIMSDNLERENGGYYTKGKPISNPGTTKRQSSSLENVP